MAMLLALFALCALCLSTTSSINITGASSTITATGAASSTVVSPAAAAAAIGSLTESINELLLHRKDKITTVLTDIDGTILNSRHALDDITVNSIKRIITASNNRYAFFPCTGRSRVSFANAVKSSFVDLVSKGAGLQKISGVFQQGLVVYGSEGELVMNG